MIRVKLEFNRSFARPLTWYWLSDEESVRCRIRVGQAPEICPVDIPIRYRGRLDSDRFHCHPLDGERFLIASGTFHPDLVRCEILLCGAPEAIALQMIQL